jgi:enoyl-CoA hydratase/carnithine racemase
VQFETLLYEVDDGVATIVLNRPERHNAFNRTMATELSRAWQAVKRDPEVVCAILTGSGEKALCTGMDVADVASGAAIGDAPAHETRPPWLAMTAIQNDCWKPVITAVNGMVVGGGLHFIADSDLIVCADHATFFDTHVRVGLIAGLEPIGLARRIPLEAVLRLALLGGSERMTAAEAKSLGLVGEVLPAAQVMPRARALAAMIAQHSPTALAHSKRLIWQSLEKGLHESLEDAWRVIEEHVDCPDLREGSLAHVEKRKPRWVPYTGEDPDSGSDV